MNAPRIEVKPGQIWTDKDWRHAGRTVRVVELDGRHAVVEVASESRKDWPGKTITIGRRSRVLYDDCGLRGYRLVTHDGEQR